MVFAHTRHDCERLHPRIRDYILVTLRVCGHGLFGEQRSRKGLYSQIVHHMESGVRELLAELCDQHVNLLRLPTQILGVEAHVDSLHCISELDEIPSADSFLYFLVSISRRFRGRFLLHMQGTSITHQVLVSRPGADRHTELLSLDILESGVVHPAFQLTAWSSIETLIGGGCSPGSYPFVDFAALDKGSVFGVVVTVEILKLGPTAGFRVSIRLINKFRPIADGSYHISNVNEVKWLRKSPRLLAIINLELDIGGYP